MPPVETVYDGDNNAYRKDKAHRIWLKLANLPTSGKQVRCLGSTKAGMWNIYRDSDWWMRNKGCWFVNVFVLKNAKLFNFNYCCLHGVLPNGKRTRGYFYPEFLLLKRGHLIRHRSYELQVELRPEDLAENATEAKAILARFKQELADADKDALVQEPPQGSLF